MDLFSSLFNTKGFLNKGQLLEVGVSEKALRTTALDIARIKFVHESRSFNCCLCTVLVNGTLMVVTWMLAECMI